MHSINEVITYNEIVLAIKFLFLISILKFIRMVLRKFCGFTLHLSNKHENVKRKIIIILLEYAINHSITIKQKLFPKIS